MCSCVTAKRNWFSSCNLDGRNSSLELNECGRGDVMQISKGPYHGLHQKHALLSVLHARLRNQITVEQVSLCYLASLNIEYYVKKLIQPKLKKVKKGRGVKRFMRLLAS